MQQRLTSHQPDMQFPLSPGLYLVATPIGNLSELSQRAVDVLRGVELILCEDTRHSARLLAGPGIGTQRTAYHRFNEAAMLDSLLQRLHKDQAIALISDAGAPGIADPGARLVSACHATGIRVVPISGPSAVINAAMASGLVEDGFCFAGFVPAKPVARHKWLQSQLAKQTTLVLFESPQRLLATLSVLRELLGDMHQLCLARELTKKFETIRRAALAEMLDWVAGDSHQQQGECTLVIAPASAEQQAQLHMYQLIKIFSDYAVPASSASAIVARLSGRSKRECYQAYLQLKDTR